MSQNLSVLYSHPDYGHIHWSGLGVIIGEIFYVSHILIICELENKLQEKNINTKIYECFFLTSNGVFGTDYILCNNWS